MDCVEEAKAASKKDPCKTLKRIAKANVQNAGDPLFHALVGCGLAMDFSRTELQLDEIFSYPCFPPKEMLETIANAGFFHKLVGMPVAYPDEVLPKLWNKYQLLFPEHEIFRQPHSVDFSHLLPFYIHGDGGRTFKKDSIMILSMFSAFGEGTRKKPVDLQPIPNSGQKRSLGASDAFEPGVNLKGNPFTNRYICLRP